MSETNYTGLLKDLYNFQKDLNRQLEEFIEKSGIGNRDISFENSERLKKFSDGREQFIRQIRIKLEVNTF